MFWHFDFVKRIAAKMKERPFMPPNFFQEWGKMESFAIRNMDHGGRL